MSHCSFIWSQNGFKLKFYIINVSEKYLNILSAMVDYSFQFYSILNKKWYHIFYALIFKFCTRKCWNWMYQIVLLITVYILGGKTKLQFEDKIYNKKSMFLQFEDFCVIFFIIWDVFILFLSHNRTFLHFCTCFIQATTSLFFSF